jgi:hypothetical protein
MFRAVHTSDTLKYCCVTNVQMGSTQVSHGFPLLALFFASCSVAAHTLGHLSDFP